MGLFGKRKASAADLASLQSDVGALRTQLEESEKARATMANQLVGVQARTMAISDSAADRELVDERFDQSTARLDDLGNRLDRMGGCLQQLPTDHMRLQRLEEQIDGLPDHGPAIDGLRCRIDQLPDQTGWLEALQQRVDQLPDHGSNIDGLAERLTATDAELADLAAQVAAAVELRQRLADLDARMVAAARRIDEQLVDLTGDVEALAALPSSTAAGIDPSALDDLRGGQTRLANEQVRFQIAVREDVAVLAEQIRRLGR